VISTQNQTQIETATKTQLTTITAQPGTVTVALQGPAAISSSLSSAFSVESQDLENKSQMAPNNPWLSAHPPTPSPTRFTRTIVVPVIEATKTSATSGQTSATDVYFIGESNGTTTWLTNFTPHESMTIGTITVTLSPVPSLPASRTGRSRLTEHATQANLATSTINRANFSPSGNGSSFTGIGYQGWNSSAIDPTTAATSISSTSGPSSFQVVTIRRSSAIATTTIHLPAPPTSLALPTDAYGSTVNITFPTAEHGYRKRSEGDARRREICERVTATMRGTPVSWPNNWDGRKTVNCATVTSSTPQYIPQPQPTLRTYLELT
jgi:hypothetical protein